jgi:PAS domain S-box-containing protein
MIYANDAFGKIFGYSREEILNLDSTYRLVAPEETAKLKARGALRMARAIVNDHYEVAGIRKDGTRIFVETSIKDIEGTDNHMVVLVRDISERKKKEEAFRQAHEVIEDLYNRAPCGYHSVDKNGVCIYINDTLLNWLGYSRTEVIGKLSITDMVTPEFCDFIKKFFARFVKTCAPADIYTVLVKKNGEHMPVLLKISAVTDAQGDFVMSRTMTLDMTDQRKGNIDPSVFHENQTRFLSTLGEMQVVMNGSKV